MFDTIIFNTQRRLFRDVRLRRAVEFALDRPALARAYYDAPAERVIPTAIPGYDAGSVYPLTGPDLRTARQSAGM